MGPFPVHLTAYSPHTGKGRALETGGFELESHLRHFLAGGPRRESFGAFLVKRNKMPTSEGWRREADVLRLPSLVQNRTRYRRFWLLAPLPGSVGLGENSRPAQGVRGWSRVWASGRTTRVPGGDRACPEQEMEWSSNRAGPQGDRLLTRPRRRRSRGSRPSSWIQDVFVWLQFSSGHKLFVFQRG